MATFSSRVVAAIREGSGIIRSTTAEPSESLLKWFQMVIPPANMTRWSIQTNTSRAVRQMRQSRHVLVQLFVHHERFKLQTKDKEGDVTTECYYNDDELEERRGIIRRQNLSGNYKKTAQFVEMTKNWKAKKLEDMQYKQ